MTNQEHIYIPDLMITNQNVYITQTLHCHHVDVLLWLKAYVLSKIHISKLKQWHDSTRGTLGGHEGTAPVNRIIWVSQLPAAHHVNTEQCITKEQCPYLVSNLPSLQKYDKTVFILYPLHTIGHTVVTAQTM